jgi:geranylgeranyl diphosphate synthase type I
VLDGYSGYGLPLGEAFQLRDDVLGVFGDPSVTASRPATTCARASAPRWSPWRSRPPPGAGRGGPPAPRRPAPVRDGVAQLRAVLTDTGAVDRVEALIDELMDDALTALAAAPVEGRPGGAARARERRDLPDALTWCG